MSQGTASATIKLRSLTKRFDDGYMNAAPFYPNLCMLVESNGADEEYASLGAVPGMREWIGDRQFNNLRSQRFVIPNKKWEDSLEIEKDDIDDDRLGLYAPAMENLGMQAALHPDELLCTAIQAGSATACIDGQYFYDTDHSFGDSGAQSNALTYNATDHTAVTPVEFKAAFHQALVALLGFKRDNGKPYFQPTINPAMLRSIIVTVPLELWEAAVTGLTAPLVGGGDSNIVLAAAQIVPVPSFTSGVKFQIYKTDMPIKPFVFQNRKALKRTMKGMDDAEFKDVKLMADARYALGYFGWWMSVETTFN